MEGDTSISRPRLELLPYVSLASAPPPGSLSDPLPRLVETVRVQHTSTIRWVSMREDYLTWAEGGWDTVGEGEVFSVISCPRITQDHIVDCNSAIVPWGNSCTAAALVCTVFPVHYM